MPGTLGSIGNGILGEYFPEREYNILDPKRTRKRPKFQPCQLPKAVIFQVERSRRKTGDKILASMHTFKVKKNKVTGRNICKPTVSGASMPIGHHMMYRLGSIFVCLWWLGGGISDVRILWQGNVTI